MKLYFEPSKYSTLQLGFCSQTPGIIRVKADVEDNFIVAVCMAPENRIGLGYIPYPVDFNMNVASGNKLVAHVSEWGGLLRPPAFDLANVSRMGVLIMYLSYFTAAIKLSLLNHMSITTTLMYIHNRLCRSCGFRFILTWQAFQENSRIFL